MRKYLILLIILSFGLYLIGCSPIDLNIIDNFKNETVESEDYSAMSFEFEALHDENLMWGSSLFMDFKGVSSTKDAILIEGKLLTLFGEPVRKSENSENSFDYIIRATESGGQSVILIVYSTGLVSIGSTQQDEFAKAAAEALMDYVSAAEPKDFERTVYYLDFNMQMDLSLKNGVASVERSEISDERALELWNEWFKKIE